MLLSTIQVATPETLHEALEILEQKKGNIRVIAGGTDVIIQLKDGIIRADELLNIRCLKELRHIKKKNNIIEIGSLTTYSDIIESELTQKHAVALVEASRTIGAVQLQNGSTIGGNLGNASPAGDSLPPLYVLGATVHLVSTKGRRMLPIEQFFLGYRKIDLRLGELIEAVSFSANAPRSESSTFLKLGLREANAISIANVAVWARYDGKRRRWKEARVALGAVAPTIVRASECERMLVEGELNDERIWKAALKAQDVISPIDDIRGSAEYRREVVPSLVFEAVQRIISGA